MKGSVNKRCPCPIERNARGQRVACKKQHGSWSYVADAGRDPATGKRRQIKRGGFTTKVEAEAALAALVDGTSRGVVPARRKDTFKVYAEGWFETRKRRVRDNTADGYHSALNHAYATFGLTPIGDVTKADIERMTHKLTDAGRSQRLLSLVLFVVRSVFEDALHEGLIARNPAARVDAVGKPAKARGAMPDTAMAKLRAHLATDRLYACWLLTLYGWRRSEVLGEQWPDVNTNGGKITVARGVVPDSSGRRHDPTDPKTKLGRRTLPMPPDVKAALRQLREQQAAEFGFEHVRTGYLAVDELGVPYRPERWSDMWREHCKAAGVPLITLHGARHTSVTTMRKAGVPDDVVAAWHGHDEVTMRRTYSHPDEDRLKAGGEALQAMYGDSRDQSVTK